MGGIGMARLSTGLRAVLLLAFGLLLLAPVGCDGGGGGGAEQRESRRPKRDTGPQETVKVEEPEEESERYTYLSIGKRDPFRSFIAKEVVVQGDGGPVGPLQLHEIDQYRLRGIVWNVGAPRALVEDPEGIGHVVELGTLIGKNWGKVTQIKPDELIITEEYRDPIENELIINEVSMRLPEPEDKKK